MSAFVEPLILYAVLFLRISIGTPPPNEAAEFSATVEIARILLYNLPSLALVWYLMLRAKSLRLWGVTCPGRGDLIPALIALPALVLIGLTISAASRYFADIHSNSQFPPPQSYIAWGILFISCLSTAYLEESFFRFYLLSRREDMGIGHHRAVLISTLLFSVCHIYEGPWGFLNAALSGVLLAYIFLRFRSLHGIAFAHALYNVLVYVLAAV